MLDFWRAKIIKNIDNADLSVRNEIEGTQSLAISHKDNVSALLRRWGSLVALIFQQIAVLGHFMLKWSVKVFLSDPTLIFALPSQFISLVEFFSSNCWICHSCYMDFAIVVKWICQKEYMDFSKLLYMSHCQMLGKFEYTLPAKFWRLVGCTEMLSW